MKFERRKEIVQTLTDCYSILEMLGQDLAATQHRLFYSPTESVEYETLEVWKRDLRGIQRRLDEIFQQLEEKRSE